jgi:TolB-like protein/DNA-binding winged helix-turn-helix (wHTH) protein/Flp pilus assembly protein TadD
VRNIDEKRVVRFGLFELDLRSRELYKQGHKLHLQEQPFQVLATLLESPGEVFPREELRRRIWPSDTFVDFEVGLNAAVKRLRQALGDSADSPRFVETLPRLGYRFLAPVTFLSESERALSATAIPAPETTSVPSRGTASKSFTAVFGAAQSLRHHWWKIAAVVLVIAAIAGFSLWPRHPAVPAPVIAVLPLKNLSGQPDSDYFSDGLTDEIIRNLSMIDGLQVRSRTSSFAFKDKPRNLREVGAELNANLVLEGSVLRSGDRLRINAQLVRVSDDTPVWSGRYDRQIKDVFAIQDEISLSIVTELRLKLGTGRRRYSTAPEIYDTYLRGLALSKGMLPGPVANLQEALRLFQEVVAKDPEFAPGHLGIARVLSKISFSRRTTFEGAFEQTRAAAEKSLQLDPLLPEAFGLLGELRAHDLDWGQAETYYRRALALDPNLSETRTSFARVVLLPLGKTDEAVSQARKALELDPLSRDASHALLLVLYVAGRFDETIHLCQRLFASDPNNVYVQHMYGRSLAQEGKLAEAIAIFEKQQDAPGTRRHLGYAYARMGRRAEAERLAAVPDPGQFRQQALIYSGLGDADRTMDALRRMAAERDPAANIYTVFPELAFLRGHPRYKEFRRKQNLPESP